MPFLRFYKCLRQLQRRRLSKSETRILETTYSRCLESVPSIARAGIGSTATTRIRETGSFFAPWALRVERATITTIIGPATNWFGVARLDRGYRSHLSVH